MHAHAWLALITYLNILHDLFMCEDLLVQMNFKKCNKISHFDTACSSHRNINKINGTLDLIDRTQMKVEMNHLKFFLLGGLLSFAMNANLTSSCKRTTTFLFIYFSQKQPFLNFRTIANFSTKVYSNLTQYGL